MTAGEKRVVFRDGARTDAVPPPRFSRSAHSTSPALETPVRKSPCSRRSRSAWLGPGPRRLRRRSSSSGAATRPSPIGSLYEPVNLDNTAGGGQGVTEALNGNVYEGLFKLTDDGKVEPLLATKYTASADGLTYTFTLVTA